MEKDVLLKQVHKLEQEKKELREQMEHCVTKNAKLQVCVCVRLCMHTCVWCVYAMHLSVDFPMVYAESNKQL